MKHAFCAIFIFQTHSSEKCTFDEKLSYKLYSEYDKMMMMVHIALDYCYNAFKLLEQKEV